MQLASLRSCGGHRDRREGVWQQWLEQERDACLGTRKSSLHRRAMVPCSRMVVAAGQSAKTSVLTTTPNLVDLLRCLLNIGTPDAILNIAYEAMDIANPPLEATRGGLKCAYSDTQHSAGYSVGADCGVHYGTPSFDSGSGCLCIICTLSRTTRLAHPYLGRFQQNWACSCEIESVQLVSRIELSLLEIEDTA